MSADGLRHVIGFIYTSEVQLSMKNVHCVLSAAGHMQLKSILHFCKVRLFEFLFPAALQCISTFRFPSGPLAAGKGQCIKNASWLCH